MADHRGVCSLIGCVFGFFVVGEFCNSSAGKSGNEALKTWEVVELT